MVIAILGRQPGFGLAELEAVFGAEAVQEIAPSVARVDRPADDVAQHDFGGIIKLGKFNSEINAARWPVLTQQLLRRFRSNYGGTRITAKPGRLTFGFSAYGFPISPKNLTQFGLTLKRQLKEAGLSARIVPNKTVTLNAAQVLHNSLIGDNGSELMLIKTNRGSTVAAETFWVQDIDAYAERDFGRPKRDAFVGMLPPKLAQTMLNLAGVTTGERVLDPFCGTGVVLQEAMLAGAHAYGSDISQKMIDYSRANMEWLAKKHATETPLLEVADATSHKWQQPIDHIVSEVYLGQPLSGLPRPEKLAEIITNCNTITVKFLQNARSQLAPGSQHCIAVPTWRVGKTFRHLALLDDLKNLGYNRVRFKHASQEDLIYHREDQIVARELLVLKVLS